LAELILLKTDKKSVYQI